MTLSLEMRGTLGVHAFVGARRFGVDAFVTDRFGGVSAGPYESLNLGDHVGDLADHVIENRRRVAEASGVERLTIVRQVHGTDVVQGTSAVQSTCADGLWSDGDDGALCVLVADCVPLLLVDESSTRFAVIHAGWRGLDAGVLTSAMLLFADPRSVHAFIGPCISGEGYQVGPDVAGRFIDVARALHPDLGDRSRLDLGVVTVDRLERLGVDVRNISRSRQSTDGAETFFSDRAARPCGRIALVARRPSMRVALDEELA